MSQQRISVPFDIRTVKRKVIGNLTKRQLVCFTLAGIVGVPIFLVTRKILPVDVSSLLMITVAAPFFVAAIYEKNQMKIEKILYNIIKWKFIFPQVRVKSREVKVKNEKSKTTFRKTKRKFDKKNI